MEFGQVIFRFRQWKFLVVPSFGYPKVKDCQDCYCWISY